MTKMQFEHCLRVARSDADLQLVDVDALAGCELASFGHTSVTVETAAKLLRENCVMFNGEVDSVELDKLRRIFRFKVELIEP